MKKFITTGLLAAAIIGGAVEVQAEEAGTAMEGVKTEHHISIAKGFQKLGRETGIYRFFNPQSKEEKKEAYTAALVKTIDAEISAGHFHGAMEQIHKAHGVDEALISKLTQEVMDAEAAGYDAPASLPEGLGQFVMILVGLLLIWLAIARKFEPLLLLPIGFGAILTNIPMAGISAGPIPGQPGGFLYYFYTVGVESGVFPLLIFMGVGAMTDFGPLLANPKTALLGAMSMGGLFTIEDAAAIGIIGGADGPTAIFLASRLSPNLLGAIAVAAYSYMALVPIIQPPIMKLFTTKAERAIVMKQLRHVSKTEKIIFPLMVLLICLLLLPSATPLIGMLMLGNLMKESAVVDRLSDTAQNSLINIVTIMLGLAVGSKLAADKFLNVQTLGILGLGLGAFIIGTATGVLLAKLMNKLSKDQINPLIGSAGVSAVPMAARVSNKVGLEANPQNFLLMHAMGPNVAGVIGSAVAAGVLLALVG